MGHRSSRPHGPPSPSTASSESPLRAFADVELQSIFHYLPTRELLRFGRLSKQLQRVFDAPLTWKHARLQLSAAYVLDHRSSFSSRLLCAAPVSLSWPDDLTLVTTHAIDLLLKPPIRMFELELQSTSFHARRFELLLAHLLAHPTLQGLRSLALQPVSGSIRYVSASNAAAIAALPSLVHLSAPGFEHWSAFSSSSSLTSIHCSDNALGIDCLAHIQRLPALRHLCLEKSAFGPGEFGRFFTSPNLLQLVSLTLDGLHCASSPTRSQTIAPEEYADAFKQLTSLRALELRRCFDIQALLPHLSHCAQLRQLTIEPHWDRAGVDCISPLFELLCGCPLISCELLLHSFHSADHRKQFAAFPALPGQQRRFEIREVPGATVQALFQANSMRGWT